MFDNVGEKIKTLAKVMFGIGCVLGFILFFLFMSIEDADFWYIGLILLIVLPFLSLISAWFLYGYGEIIENTAISAKNTKILATKDLTDVFIAYGANRIEKDAYSNCVSIKKVSIPNTVTCIGSNAFAGCIGLTSIIIPNSVTSIGANAFAGCTGLTSIMIPNSVTNIGANAFAGCTGLTSITIPNSISNIEENVFWGCTIGENAFSKCTALTSVVIPDSVVRIKSRAFKNCTQLQSIEIPKSVLFMGANVFENCELLTINAKVKSKPIGWNEKWNNSNCAVVWNSEETQ